MLRQRAPEAVVTPIRRSPLRAVLPQADDVFHAVAVTVQGQDSGARPFDLLGDEEVKRAGRVWRGTDNDLVPHVAAAIDALDLARLRRVLFLVQESERLRQ